MSVFELFISLFFGFLGFYYRFEFGIVSFAFIEPFAIVFIVIAVINFLMKGRFTISNSWYLFVLLSFFCLLVILLPFSFDLKRSLSDIRDWMVPLFTSAIIFSIRNVRWEKILIFFILLSVLFGGIGFYQCLTDSFRPFATEKAKMKTGLTLSEYGKPKIASAAVAFFPHPNQFATYLICSFIIGLGFLVSSSKKVAGIIILLFITIALILTYSKASIFLLPLGISMFFFLYLFSSMEELFILIFGSVIIVLIFSLYLYISLPKSFLGTLLFRFELFSSVFETISENPFILIVGNGAKLYSLISSYPNPHNLYLYFLINYGVIGLGILLVIFGKIIILTLKGFQKGLMRKNPLLASLATSLIFGFFLLGLTEVPLQDINLRTLFFLLIVAFVSIYNKVEKNSLRLR